MFFISNFYQTFHFSSDLVSIGQNLIWSPTLHLRVPTTVSRRKPSLRRLQVARRIYLWNKNLYQSFQDMGTLLSIVVSGTRTYQLDSRRSRGQMRVIFMPHAKFLLLFLLFIVLAYKTKFIHSRWVKKRFRVSLWVRWKILGTS